jgi:lysophospholipase L1-like esterase
MSRALVLPGTATQFVKSNALGTLANARVEMRIRNLAAGSEAQVLTRLAEAMKLQFSAELLFITFFSLKTGESVSDFMPTQDPGNSSLPRHTDYLIRWQFDSTVPRYSLEMWAIDGTDRIAVVTTAGVTSNPVDISSFVSIGNDFGFSTRLVSGSIDWYRIYNTNVALASAAPSSNIPAPGTCVANWEFEDSLADSSGNGHTMVWQGAGGPTYQDTPGGGVATQLVVTTQPGNAGSGDPQVPQIVAEFRDAGGALVATETSDVVITLVVTAGSGTPVGTLTKAAAGGVANFAGNGHGVTSAGGATAHWHLQSGLLSTDTADFTITPPPSVPADVATLIAAFGGNAEVDYFFDTEQGVTQAGGVMTAWDDVRGAGFAPQAVGMKGAGAFPAWNAGPRTIVTDGVQNWLQTAAHTRFDMSGDETLIEISAMAAPGAFGVHLSTLSGFAKTYGLGMDGAGAYVSSSSSAPVAAHAPPGNSAALRLITNSRGMVTGGVPGDAYQYLEVWGRLRRTATAEDASMAPGALALTVGRLPGSGGGYSAIAVKVLIKVKHQLSMAEHDALVTFAAGRGVTVDSSAPTIIADGDSLTFGLRSSDPVTKSWLAQMITAHAATFAGWDVLKHGVNSRTLVTMLASTRGGTSTRQKDSTLSAYNSLRARNIYICPMGTNDLRTLNPSAATLEAQLAAAYQAAKTRGFLVVVVTILPSSDIVGTAETTRLAVNAYLRANYLTFGHALADVASNPALIDPTNGAYYYSDQLHLIDAGYDEYGNDPVYGVWAAVSSLLGSGGSSRAGHLSRGVRRSLHRGVR